MEHNFSKKSPFENILNDLYSKFPEIIDKERSKDILYLDSYNNHVYNLYYRYIGYIFFNFSTQNITGTDNKIIKSRYSEWRENETLNVKKIMNELIKMGYDCPTDDWRLSNEGTYLDTLAFSISIPTAPIQITQNINGNIVLLEAKKSIDKILFGYKEIYMKDLI